MRSNIELEKLYKISKLATDKLISRKNFSEEDLLKIIFILHIDNEFKFYHKNNYNLEALSKLLRFYEEELKNSFTEDKERFNTLFKMYLLIIELCTALCILFSENKEKRILIDSIFQILKESKNMLKFFVPFEENDLMILNNLIGEQLYYFSHLQYIHTKDKTLDYIFEEYFLYCECMQHGFELSKSSNFGDNPYKNSQIEEMIYINNLSFLLLKMTHKLAFYRSNIDYSNNDYFLNIKNFFKNMSFLNKDSNLESKDDFEEALLEEFDNSANFLKKAKNYNMWDEKIKLLALNTDEYKHLIDIIRASK